jgi:hypothetical protein
MMLTRRICTLALAVAAAFILADAALARVKTQIDFDKAFDFKPVKTWRWNPEGAGEVKVGRNKDDDPAAFKKRAEPIILSAVDEEMPKRKLAKADTDAQLTLTYYLLLTMNLGGQTMGQFLPGTVAWGLPPFAQVTQSLELMNQGALVLDFSANGSVVWRGVAQAEIKLDADNKKRESLLREAVRDLLKKFPPKP